MFRKIEQLPCRNTSTELWELLLLHMYRRRSDCINIDFSWIGNIYSGNPLHCSDIYIIYRTFRLHILENQMVRFIYFFLF